jgi:hypothetical protein
MNLLNDALPKPAGLLVQSNARNLVFYLAGKISHTDWRHELVTGGRGLRNFDYDEDAPFADQPILRNALGSGLHYSGPHFNSCDHGCAHGPNQHGVLECCLEDIVPERDAIPEAALIQIHRADILFAWIEAPTCCGSLAEIGIARAFHKEIWIGWDPAMTLVPEKNPQLNAAKADLWFAESLADYSCSAPDAKTAFRHFLAQRRRMDSPKFNYLVWMKFQDS